MTLEKIGILFKENIKTKDQWIKLGVSLVLSNILFFMLFGGASSESNVTDPEGLVEIQLPAELLTSYSPGKKVLIVHRTHKKKVVGYLQSSKPIEGKIGLFVNENEAHALIQSEGWEVLPYIKNLNFASVKTEEAYEIHY